MPLTRSYALAFSLLGALSAACTDDAPSTSEVASVRGGDPTLLSARSLYTDLGTRTPAPGALEYQPDQTLWSDGVDKRRWLLLPAGAQIDTSDMAHWRFPVGTKLVKEFAQSGSALETRLIEKVADTGDLKVDYFLGTFVWIPGQAEARLTATGVSNVNGTAHDVPQQEQCLQCHQSEPGAALGLSAVQLSRSGMLTQLAQRGLLSNDPGRTFPIPGDDLQRRALGVLHANCGHCHSEGGMGSMMRMRFLPHEADLPLEQSELYRTTIGQLVTDWLPHPAAYSRRIVAGDPDHSAAIYRMERRSGDGFTMDQMPPIATERRDEEGIALVRAWIAGLAHDTPIDFNRADAASPDAPHEVPSAMDAGVAAPGELALDRDAGPDATAVTMAGDAGALDDMQDAAGATPAIDAAPALDASPALDAESSEGEATETQGDGDATVGSP